MSLASPSDDQRFGLSRRAILPGPLRLDGGASLSPIEIAYETYGTLDSEAGNAILVCHALTGDHHLASPHPRTGKPGWWQRMVGPGKPIDTNRFFIVCANVLGSCMGSSGPASINPATGRAWVAAGTRLADAVRQLHGVGLGLPNQGDYDRQTMSGATSGRSQIDTRPPLDRSSSQVFSRSVVGGGV